MGLTLKEQLAELATDRARAEKKAEWVKNAVTVALAAQKVAGRDWTFERADGKKVAVETVALGVLDLASGTVKPAEGKTSAVWIRMRVDGKYENGDGWYGFVNPPISMPDGGKDSVISAVTGERVEVETLKVDVPGVLKRLVGA